MSANPIGWRHTATGATLYFTIRNLAGQYWNTHATANFEALLVGNWYSAGSNNYVVAMSESPASSYYYTGTFPAISGNMVAGWYWIDVYLRAGASPAISDSLVATMLGYWDGTTFKPQAADTIAIGGVVQPAGGVDVQTIKTRAVGDPGAGTTVYFPIVAYGSPSGPPVLGSSGFLPVDLQTITGQAVTCAAAVTIAAYVGNATQAIVVDANGYVTYNNDSTPAPTNMATASGQTSILNAVNALTRQTARSMPVVGSWFVRTATGVATYSVDLYLYNLAGQLEDPDSSAVTCQAGSTAGGTEYAANLVDTVTGIAATAMDKIATGHYRLNYNVAGLDQSSPHAQGEAYFSFSWTITETVGGSPTAVSGADAAVVQVQDAEQLATLNTIESRLGVPANGHTVAGDAATAAALVIPTPPSTGDIAGAILATPAQKLATDASGNVAANNLPSDYLSSTEQTQLAAAAGLTIPTPPTADAIAAATAAAILKTPTTPLANDTSGALPANNLPADYLNVPERAQLAQAGSLVIAPVVGATPAKVQDVELSDAALYGAYATVITVIDQLANPVTLSGKTLEMQFSQTCLPTVIAFVLRTGGPAGNCLAVDAGGTNQLDVAIAPANFGTPGLLRWILWDVTTTAAPVRLLEGTLLVGTNPQP